jgi:hypothetical protein
MDGQKIFEGAKGYSPKYSNFDLSYEYKGSGNFGGLYPVGFMDVMPGDSIKWRSEIMLRFAPLLAPIMHRVNVYIHFFEVPWRQVWDEWEDFITGGDDGTASPTFPVMTGTLDTAWTKGRIGDYFGIPPYSGAATTDYDFISKLPFRAYRWIWSEYYRDQNLQNAYDPLDGTTQTDSYLTTVMLRSWEKDYFTSALPDLQKGSASTVAVTHTGPTPNYKTPATFGAATAVGDIKSDGSDLQDSGSTDIALHNLDSTTPITLTSTVDINDLRLASRLQEWWERRSRGGSRYTEMILSEFGVKSSDARLQRPRYLGGGKQNVVISEVLQTSEDGTTPLAEMAGNGIAVGGDNSFQAFFEEYGCVMAILSVMPRTAYMDGVPKFFLKDDRFDFPFPAFSHLGEQVVENRELYFDATSGGDDPTGTFGYQQRYAEYKQKPSMIVGDFRDTLDHWHIARQFTAEPSLNQDFIQCDPDDEDINRIFASQVPSDHKIWFQIYHQVHARRPLPYFSDPRL